MGARKLQHKIVVCLCVHYVLLLFSMFHYSIEFGTLGPAKTCPSLRAQQPGSTDLHATPSSCSRTLSSDGASTLVAAQATSKSSSAVTSIHCISIKPASVRRRLGRLWQQALGSNSSRTFCARLVGHGLYHKWPRPAATTTTVWCNARTACSQQWSQHHPNQHQTIAPDAQTCAAAGRRRRAGAPELTPGSQTRAGRSSRSRPNMSETSSWTLQPPARGQRNEALDNQPTTQIAAKASSAPPAPTGTRSHAAVGRKRGCHAEVGLNASTQ